MSRILIPGGEMKDQLVKNHCTYLGTDDDRTLYCLFPSSCHRCYYDGTPRLITEEHQAHYCLHSHDNACAHLALPQADGDEKWAGGMTRMAVMGGLLLLAAAAGAVGLGLIPVHVNAAGPVGSALAYILA